MSDYTDLSRAVKPLDEENPRVRVGDNSGNVHHLDEKRAAIFQFVEQVQEARRVEDAMAAADFCAMDSSGKLSTMKKVRLDMLVRLHALDPKLDVDASIAILIVDLSDNEHGKSNISIARLAALLSRDVKTIQKAITRLAEKYLIIRDRPTTGAVRRNTYRPFIKPALADQSTTLKSVMDAYAPPEDPREYKKPGRPVRLSEILEKKAKTHREPVARLVSDKPNGSLSPAWFPETENLTGVDEKPTGRLSPVTEESLKGISKEIITTVEFVERESEGEDASPSAQPDEPYQIDLEEAIAQVKVVEVIEPEVVHLVPAKPKAEKDRGSRLPEDWALTEEEVNRIVEVWAISYPQVIQVAREFKNYWLDVPGKAGRKVNWKRTLTNRLDDLFPRRGEEAHWTPKYGRRVAQPSRPIRAADVSSADIAAALWNTKD